MSIAPISDDSIYEYVIRCLGKPKKPISDELEANYYAWTKYRLRDKFGNPGQYVCFDCNKPGSIWSYCLTDPNEYSRSNGQRYSISLRDYVPRCNFCQYQFRATEGLGNSVVKVYRCKETHVVYVPNSSAENYEFRFCKTCGQYRRFPRKDYYAQAAFPTLSLGPSLLIEL